MNEQAVTAVTAVWLVVQDGALNKTSCTVMAAVSALVGYF